jgi:hypothetical protein
MRGQRRHLPELPDGNAVPEPELSLHPGQLSEWVLPERSVSTRDDQCRLWGQRDHLRELSSRHRVRTGPELHLHPGQLPQRLLREWGVPDGRL